MDQQFELEATTSEKMRRAIAAEESEMFTSAMSVLHAWLTQRDTDRHVREIGQTVNGTWRVVLSAGSFRFESESQFTLAGAIRNALQAAVLI